MKYQIRDEIKGDYSLVFNVNTKSFETPLEANLVEKLRKNVSPIISLVADNEGLIIGHIMFSPVTMEGHPDTRMMGLGPMAVLPEYQNKGVGSRLVVKGIEKCKDMGYDAIIVLGHPTFYPRFGFIPSVRFGIASEYKVPEDVFMVLELVNGSLSGVNGIVKYDEVFRGA